jgi:AcrR family transcriptional regulator
MKNSAGRGRRRGQPETRDRIRDVARAHFLADGYRNVTLRTVAAEAGVDVALVSYYFGSKQGLFGAAMALPANPADVLAAVLAPRPDPATLAETLSRRVLALWGSSDAGPALRSLGVAALSDPEQNRLVRELVDREIIDRITEYLRAALGLTAAEAGARAAAFTAQMAGIIFSRYLLGLEPIASMPDDEVVARLAPSLALALNPEI